ncbi:MAG: hypothetical protein CFE32_05635 [Alphaproteobacteria bacterium PA3]|nr:MAG: hypothetical protein CFE32_05635 [Alphaproteobacteria bacterium PA3]
MPQRRKARQVTVDVKTTRRGTLPRRCVRTGHVGQFRPGPVKETMMMTDGKDLKMPAATDFEGMLAQLTALRDDMAKLTGSVTTLAERRGRKMATDISDGMAEAVHYAERKTVGAEADLEKSVATHPLIALGLAASVGLLIGAMTRRG